MNEQDLYVSTGINPWRKWWLKNTVAGEYTVWYYLHKIQPHIKL